MLNKYKFNNQEFLVYSDNEIKFPEDLQIQLLEENVDPSKESSIPILQFEQFMYRLLHQKSRIPDKILEEEGITTWDHFSLAYFLIRTKQFNKPKRIRDLVVQKYADVVHYTHPNIDESSNLSKEKE